MSIPIETAYTYVSNAHNICPRSLDPFYLVSYYIDWAKTSWTDSTSLIFLELATRFYQEHKPDLVPTRPGGPHPDPASPGRAIYGSGF